MPWDGSWSGRAAEDAVGSHFDARAGRYDAMTPWVHDERSLSPISTFLRKEEPHAVLELGVGTGAVPKYLRRTGVLPPTYVGVDVSAEMLRHAEGWTPIHANAENLPFSCRVFDVVIVRQAMHYFRSPSVVVGEIARVLRPTGALVVAQIVAFDDDLDVAWWSRAVSLRQPLRRPAVDPAEIRRVFEVGRFSVESVTEVHGRSALGNWLRRYPLGRAAQVALQEHFQKAPEVVRNRRQLALRPDGDMEFSIRWLVWVARRAPGEMSR